MTELAAPNGAEKIVSLVQLDRGEPPAAELKTESASTFAGKKIPPRSWLVKDLIPDRQVTILSGDGGVGKSLLAKQLAVAVVTATDWIGTVPEPGPIIYFSAEDDRDEIHRRLADIIAVQSLDFRDFNWFHLVLLAGKDAVLAIPNSRTGTICPTSLFVALVDKIGRIKPRLLILDNLADVFVGNENSRPEARQFIGLLRGIAIDHALAVLLIAHPSLTGISTGSGTSGSTAWSNSVRSRLYLEKPKADGDVNIDPDLRVLRVMKTNYGPPGTEIRLRWENGRFRLDAAPGSFDKLAANLNADRVFLELVGKFKAEGRDVSPNPSITFAPKVFARHPGAQGCSEKALRAAMDRLLASKKIQIERFGPPSKQRSRVIIAGQSEEE
jgi:RecA-family ATPase